MSGDGFGFLVGAAVVMAVAPAIIAGAAVIGTIYGTAKLVSFAARGITKSAADRREQERRRSAELAKMNAQEKKQVEQLLSAFGNTRAAQEKAVKELNEHFAADMAKLSADVKNECAKAGAKMDQIERDLRRRSDTLVKSWHTSMDALGKTYADKVNGTVDDLKARVANGNAVFKGLMKQLAPDAALKTCAESQIAQAKAALAALRLEKAGAGAIPEKSINTAVGYFNNGLYENAFNAASAATLACYTDLGSAISEREKALNLMDKIEVRTILLEGMLESYKNHEFEYKGERLVEDLTRFEPEIFNGIARQISEVKAKLSADDIMGLNRAAAKLDELEYDMKEAVALSAKELVYAYMENDAAADLENKMAEQGFIVEDYAYKRNREGGPMHINFYSPVSGEKLTVVLSPAEGGIKVDVHNFGNGRSGGMADPVRQAKIREVIDDALGLNGKYKVNCSNPGVNSTATAAADLAKVRAQ